MKLYRLVLSGVLVVIGAAFLASTARADGLPPGDPQIGVGGELRDDPVGLITTSFTVSTTTGSAPPCEVTEGPYSTGSPDCQLWNVISDDGVGQFIDSVSFDVSTLPYTSTVVDTCTFAVADTVGNLFDSCGATPDGSGGTLFSFSGGTATDTLYGGIIPYGTVFTVEFAGFTGPVSAAGSAQLPEPGTLPLLLIALVAL